MPWRCLRPDCDFKGENTGEAGEHDMKWQHVTVWSEE